MSRRLRLPSKPSRSTIRAAAGAAAAASVAAAVIAAAQAEPENPALAVRQAMNEHYAQAVMASKRAAAARQAAKGRRLLSGSPQQVAMAMLPSFGWSASEFSCLSALWDRESGWNPYAANPSSGAYGIPQALPGSKMAAAGPDWQTDAATQIRWGASATSRRATALPAAPGATRKAPAGTSWGRNRGSLVRTAA